MATTSLRDALAISLDSVPCTPWRNGGGVTRELLAWPSPSDWGVRISVADIAADGPFSAFPGVQRWFTLLSGQGVALDLQGQPHALRLGDAPLAFDGALAPDCRLIDGPVRDLNLMCRGGAGGMAPVRPASPWQPPPGAQAGLFTAVAGRWQAPGLQRELPAHTLLWCHQPPSGHWHFQPEHQPPALPAGWWLHFLPTHPQP
jgi:hypothetical protein